MSRLSAAAVAWLALAAIGSTTARGGQRLLLAVGNNRGLASERPLQHAAQDARRIASVLTALGSVGRSDARVLADRPVAELIAELEQMRSRAARGAGQHGGRPIEMAILYFSGHGDGQHLHLGKERIAIAELRRRLARVPARLRLMVVDACRTGGSWRAKGIATERPFAISLRRDSGPSGVAVVHSSSAGEAAQESDEVGGALFTHYLVSGLRGGADRDGDEQVTFAEAYAHAYHRTLQRSASSTGPVQRPSVELTIAGAGPLVLTRTAAARARLTLPAGSDVHYLVYRLPAATLVAETWSLPGRPLTLALPRGRFLVQRRGSPRPGATEVWLQRGGHRQLSAGDFVAVPRRLLALKGGRLQLRRHRAAVGYGLAFGLRTNRPGHRLRLGYGYRFGTLILGGAVALGIDDHASELQTSDEQWIGGELRLDWQLLQTGRFSLLAGGGAMLRLVRQQLQRTDAARLQAAGYEPGETTHTALAAGPMVELSGTLTLSQRFALYLAARAVGLALREEDDVAFDFNGSIESGLTFSF